MCEYCVVIDEYMHGRGEQEDGIFYDSKFNKYYLVIEEFRYERVEKEICFCPMCGEKLNHHL